MHNRKPFYLLIICLALFLGIEIAFLSIIIEQAIWQTICLLISVSLSGLLLIQRLQNRLGDPDLQLLGYVWLSKLLLSICLLYAGWIPLLDPATNPDWGFDPMRYYLYAQELVENGFSLPMNISLNYAGILYYYGIIFALLGNNPVIRLL